MSDAAEQCVAADERLAALAWAEWLARAPCAFAHRPSPLNAVFDERLPWGKGARDA